jgi:hypothetical protein
MRKIAVKAYDNYYHSKSVSLAINEQQTTSGHVQQNKNSSSQLNSYSHTNDENKISSKSTKKYLWSRSPSKAG